MDACAKALESGKPVRLESEYFGPLRNGALPSWYDLTTPLEILRVGLTMQEEDDDGYAAQHMRPALASLVEQTVALVRAACQSCPLLLRTTMRTGSSISSPWTEAFAPQPSRSYRPRRGAGVSGPAVGVEQLWSVTVAGAACR